MDYEITEDDMELIEKARDIIRKRYREGWHSIGSAIRTKSGKVITAVHIEANVGRIAVCAEAIAIGKAISEGLEDFDTIVAVAHPHPEDEDHEITVVSPCGMCRELISDYGEDVKVIYPSDGGIRKSDVLDLLPFKYK
jgi:cytidine deaminase